MSTTSKAVGGTAAFFGLAAVAASLLNSKFKVITETAQKALLGAGAGVAVIGSAILLLGKKPAAKEENVNQTAFIEYNTYTWVQWKGQSYTFTKDKEYSVADQLAWPAEKIQAHGFLESQNVKFD